MTDSFERQWTPIYISAATSMKQDEPCVPERVARAMVAAALERVANDLERRGHKTTAAMARSFANDDARAALKRLLEEARREEREACAELVWESQNTGRIIAAAIRARGETS